MKRSFVAASALLLCLLVAAPQVMADTITFTDPSNDAIGVGFESYWAKVTNPYGSPSALISFELATDYPMAGITVGGWATRPADLFFYDSTGNYAIPLVTHDGFNAGSWYRVLTYAVSDDFEPAGGGFIYNHNVPVSILTGTYLGYQGGVSWIDNGLGQSNWLISLPAGNIYEDVPSFSFVWGTATCANDVISGSYPVPDGGSMVMLLGMALMGLAGVRRMMK